MAHVYRSRFLFLSALLSAAGVAGPAAFCAAGATPEGRRLVAREDVDAGDTFAPPEISGRRFWNMLPAGAKLEKGKDAITGEAMVREAAGSYHVEDLRAPGDDPLAVNGDKLYTLKPDPAVPFLVSCGAGRPPFRCMDDFHADKKSYEAWKREHPNFLGFRAGSEWDNQFISHMFSQSEGTLAEGHRAKWTETAVARTKALRATCSADRDAAVRGLHECYKGIRRYYFDDPDKMTFLRAGWSFDHYCLEWGAGLAVLETTSTGNYRHQVGMAFIRGASRQYGRPWVWYMASYYNGYQKDGTRSVNNEPNYVSTTRSDTVGLEENSGPGFGMSVSLKRRDNYLAYLSGASVVEHEDWGRAYCRLEPGNPPKWSLSPHGEAMKEWYAFTQRHPGRGVSYAPVALLVPFSQGMPVDGGNPFSFFPVERPDTMVDGFLYTLVPHAQDLRKGKEGCLSNSRYGDIYDVLAGDPPGGSASLAALSNYKVAVLLGKQNIGAPIAARFMDYVRQGGTLVINARQVTQHFPAEFLGAKLAGKTAEVAGPVTDLAGNGTVALSEPYDYEPLELSGAQPVWTDSKGGVLASVNGYGRGRVVLTSVDYLMPRNKVNMMAPSANMPLIGRLMEQIVREVLPVAVEGDIEYGLNRVDGGWWLYLINNRGVTKFTQTPDELDPAETARVTVDLRALRVNGVRELLTNEPAAFDRDKNKFTIQVGPGDIRIVEIKAGGVS